MKNWLNDALLNCHQSIPEEVLGYYLGRGLPKTTVDSIHVGEWVVPDSDPPDPKFSEDFGPRGSRITGYLSIPMWTPSGKILGVEFRCWREKKKVKKFFLPDAEWAAAFVGMCPEVLEKIKNGANIWLVEGVFDLTIGHVIPDKDVVLGCGGAKISASQKNFIVRFLRPGSQVFLVFDEDQTGREHAGGYVDQRTGRYVPGVRDKLEREGVAVQEVRYRGGKDPGEIWDSRGRAGLLEAFNMKGCR